MCECPCIVSHPKHDYHSEVVISIFKMAAGSSVVAGFRYDDGTLCKLYFNDIFESTAGVYIYTDFVAPWQNFTSGFDFDLCIFTDMSFCICLPNVVVIERLVAELWRHIDFSRWQPQSRKSLSGFWFSDGICLRRWKSICTLNFDEISKSTAEIKLLPVFENEILEFYFLFPFWPMCSYRHVSLHLPAKFCNNPAIGGGVMM